MSKTTLKKLMKYLKAIIAQTVSWNWVVAMDGCPIISPHD